MAYCIDCGKELVDVSTIGNEEYICPRCDRHYDREPEQSVIGSVPEKKQGRIKRALKILIGG